MIAVVLGLGFQWWPALTEPWHYIAFIFVYVDIVDYWMDYGPSLKKFPPKREIDIILDILIMFALFLYIFIVGAALALLESVLTLALMLITKYFTVHPLYSLLIFISFRVVARVLASLHYKKAHFV